MTSLSTNFLLREFTRSEIAIRAGRVIEVPAPIEANLRRLCDLVLEPIRAEFDGRRIRVLSGYRPPWLNLMAHGSPKSEHMHGRAADIEIEGVDNYQAAVRIGSLLHRLPVNQLILEYPPDGWIHVSVCAAEARPLRQILTARRVGRAIEYTTGLWRAAA